ncbi:MAG TPA: O-methyltransferase [Acidimicrobiia bacterium]|nr:O-methyltransferase [Acidimicrobiia bacterium]
MTQERWATVDRYLTELLVPADAALERALRRNASAGLPAVDVSPTQGMLLYLLTRMRGARLVLEVGTLGGYSTIWLARAVAPSGHVVTLEASPDHAQVARDNLAYAGLSGVVDVRVGDALDTLPELAAEPRDPFDVVFLDADKRHNPEYFEWAMALTGPGSVIVADNVVRGGQVADATSDDPDVRGARTFLEQLAAEPRVTATAVQTVGSKGYDGFAIALVTGSD